MILAQTLDAEPEPTERAATDGIVALGVTHTERILPASRMHRDSGRAIQALGGPTAAQLHALFVAAAAGVCGCCAAAAAAATVEQVLAYPFRRWFTIMVVVTVCGGDGIGGKVRRSYRFDGGGMSIVTAAVAVPRSISCLRIR